MLATKVRFPVSDPGGQGLEPDRIRAACDASLRRLGVDEIDLYQVHAPDPGVPLEATLEARRLAAPTAPAPAYPQRFLREQNGIEDVASLGR